MAAASSKVMGPNTNLLNSEPAKSKLTSMGTAHSVQQVAKTHFETTETAASSLRPRR